MVWYEDILGTAMNTLQADYIKYPWVLLIFIPVVIVLWILLRRKFVEFKDEKPEQVQTRKRVRKVIFVLRSLIFLLILIAIATPYVEQTKIIEDDPFVRVIIDNSTSMNLLDTGSISTMIAGLQSEINVEVLNMPGKDDSAIGDMVLDHIGKNENILLVSDGNNNKGADLGDVALYASRLNASLNVVELDEKASDARVVIRGPEQTLENVENEYTVSVRAIGQSTPPRPRVLVDNVPVECRQISLEECVFSRSFADGTHRITATIETQDAFQENNVFYKTVKVVPKPRILFVSEKESPLYNLFSQVYDVTKQPSIPDDLSRYHTVVLNNLPATRINDKVSDLTDYVTDGNGLMVVGGMNSYDRGVYKDSLIESILPVSVGEAAKQEGDVNVVLVIDISGSTGQTTHGGAEAVDIEKSLALGVLGDLRFDNKLAIVAFNVDSYLIEPLSYIYEKQDVDTKVKRLKDGKGTLIDAGILRAIDLLKSTQGSKNIILISDGLTQIIPRTVAAAELSRGLGIKIYTVGVGKKTNEKLMKAIADITSGIYFKAGQENRLKILFGDIDEQNEDEFGVVVLNANHFITENLDISAEVLGYNQVVPKSAGRLLLTTSTGEPLLTVWRFGLGRVASYTTDDGSLYAGELLSKNNSKVLTRTINWASGSLERKLDNFISVPDTRVYESTLINIRTEIPPSADDILFYKVEDGLYEAEITPTTQGFNTIMNTVFAANYPREYEAIGMNPDLEGIVSVTEGKVFQSGDIANIIEHVKSRSVRTERKKDNLRWPFIIAAMIVFLLEILMRKLIMNRRA